MFLTTDSNSKTHKNLIDDFKGKSGFDFSGRVGVITDNDVPCEGECDVWVIPYEYKLTPPENSVTYSLSNNSARAVLINIQNHTHSKSFEIMFDSNMGRVFIDNSNKTSPRDVLICAAAFLAAGMDFQRVLDVLNEILK